MQVFNKHKKQLIRAGISAFMLGVYLFGVLATNILHPLSHAHESSGCHEHHSTHSHQEIATTVLGHSTGASLLEQNNSQKINSCVSETCIFCHFGAFHQVTVDSLDYIPILDIVETPFICFLEEYYQRDFFTPSSPRAPPFDVV